MALPWDPTTGAYVPTGALANPIQNPLDPRNEAATLNAMAQARAKRNALEQALYRAAALREQPLYAQGSGPLGARMGQGPGGWAITIGDLVHGLMARKKQNESAQEVTGGMAQLSPAEQSYVEQYLQGDVSALPRTGKPPMSYVPQGSPLSLSDF